jgi:BirA family biotin operon repressor/biotin-[acetyl-CoA-carboxylase] ligase
MSDRALLERLGAGAVTGSALARELGITRSAVHKRIESLRAAGIDIDGQAGHGYALARTLDLLDRETLLAQLRVEARSQLHSLRIEFETTSTQALAVQAGAPEQGCAVWLAERQTEGQGRRGRAWVSPLAANLYLSLARRFDRGFAALSGLSLAVGVAVAESLRSLGAAQVGVKWPNDLVADGRKLGGILIQLRGEAQGPCEAVIGIGLNVRMPAKAAVDIDQAWCDLSQLLPGKTIARTALAAIVLDRLLLALAQFESEGLAPFLPRWRELDALAGQAVSVLDGAQVHEGTALGVDATGALRVRIGGGERQFHGGEASLRPL